LARDRRHDQRCGSGAEHPAAVTVSLRDDPDAGRYEVRADGELVGFAQYRLRNGRIVFFHTEITSTAASAASSPGLRSRTQGRAGWRWCRCAFIAGFIRRHPDEYLLLVLPGMREQVMRDAGRD
jgi:uncharacterized protein